MQDLYLKQSVSTLVLTLTLLLKYKIWVLLQPLTIKPLNLWIVLPESWCWAQSETKGKQTCINLSWSSTRLMLLLAIPPVQAMNSDCYVMSIFVGSLVRAIPPIKHMGAAALHWQEWAAEPTRQCNVNYIYFIIKFIFIYCFHCFKESAWFYCVIHGVDSWCFNVFI